MCEKQFEKIIIHQVNLILQDRRLKTHDLSTLELLQYKYKVALMLLCELGGKNEK
jgi:hypothetical protein